MSLQQHPICPEDFPRRNYVWGAEQSEAPASEDLLDVGWRGIAGYEGDFITVSISPSAAHEGFCDYRIVDSRDWIEACSRRPVRADVAIGFALHGLRYGPERFVWAPFAPDALVPAQETKPTPKRERAPSVYFIEAGPFVKIGFSMDAENRMAQLQCGSPYALKIVARMSGTFEDEQTLHRRFAEYRANGEWFRNEGALAEYIGSLR